MSKLYCRYAIVIKLLQVLHIGNIKKLWRSLHEVHVCVYEAKEQGWLIRIGCCQADRREEMDLEMRSDKFSFVTYFTTRMHHGAILAIDFNGFYTHDNDENVIV